MAKNAYKNKEKQNKLFQLCFILSNHKKKKKNCVKTENTKLFYCISWKFYTKKIEK